VSVKLNQEPTGVLTWIIDAGISVAFNRKMLIGTNCLMVRPPTKLGIPFVPYSMNVKSNIYHRETNTSSNPNQSGCPTRH